MPDPINDAEAYGVRIIAADVAPGEEYWKVIRVHHRTPAENGGNHHIYVDVLDADSARIFGARLLVTWNGGSQDLTIDKPLSEPGTNFPMFHFAVHDVVVISDLLSDKVENIHTGHDDEAPGNTLFHHSFDIDFQRTVAGGPPPPPEISTLGGRVPDGAGHTLVLLLAGTEIETTQAGADTRYRFQHLAAGQYTVRDQNDGRQAGPIAVDGSDAAFALDLPELSPALKPLSRYLLFGSLDLPVTQLYLSLLADYLSENALAFGFSAADAAKAERVTLVGAHPPQMRAMLEAAGCVVDELPTEPGALLAAVMP